MSTVAEATRVFRSWQGEKKREIADAQRRYVALLMRSDKPQQHDAQELADLMEFLEYTPEKLAADTDAIGTANEMWERVNNKEQATHEHSKALAAKIETVRRHDRELKAAEMRVLKANAVLSQAGEAIHSLRMLRNRFPHLFDDADTPQLLKAE